MSSSLSDVVDDDDDDDIAHDVDDVFVLKLVSDVVRSFSALLLRDT